MTSNEADRLTAPDRTEIADLCARCALAIDFGDGADWAECLTPGGTFTAHRGEGTEPRGIEGHGDLDSFARQHRAGQNGGTRHHEDVLVREAGRWLFRSRVVTRDRPRP